MTTDHAMRLHSGEDIVQPGPLFTYQQHRAPWLILITKLTLPENVSNSLLCEGRIRLYTGSVVREIPSFLFPHRVPRKDDYVFHHSTTLSQQKVLYQVVFHKARFFLLLCRKQKVPFLEDSFCLFEALYEGIFLRSSVNIRLIAVPKEKPIPFSACKEVSKMKNRERHQRNICLE